MTLHNRQSVLSPHWLQAALLGSLWASNEIIIGSFLHNLNVPFAGTILASIGVCILTAGLCIWKDPRILWRAGIICALMKSVSPSALILGPMVGIMLEACFFWICVVALRSHTLGIVLGAIMATVTPLMQLLTGLVVTYGLDLARLYVVLFDTTSRNLRLDSLSAESAVILLIALTAVPGLLAAGLGIRIARSIESESPSASRTFPLSQSATWNTATGTQHYSLPQLGMHALLLFIGLALLSRLPLWGSSLFVVAYAIYTLSRYPRIRHRFSHPRLWLELILVALLAGLFLGQLSSGLNAWSWAGLLTGLQMAVRAVFVVLSFSALSIELRNPVVGRWFLRRGLDATSRALDVAFEALPTMTAALGEQRLFFRHPLRSLTRMVGTAVSLVPHFQLHATGQPAPLILLSGSQGSGKTTLMEYVVRNLQSDGMRIGGVLSPVVYVNGERRGYDVVEIGTGLRCPLCRRESGFGNVSTGPFSFDEAVFDRFVKVLRGATTRECDLLVVDEVGPLELSGGGWASALDQILREKHVPVIIAVRPQIVESIIKRWQIEPLRRWDALSTDKEEALRDVRTLLLQNRAGEDQARHGEVDDKSGYVDERGHKRS